MQFSGVLDHLIHELTRLPGIGAKTAERLAFHLLKAPKAEALALAEAIRRLKEELRQCQRCHNIADGEFCEICKDPARDHSIVCVVEHPKDVQVIEASGAFQGLYHVLGGSFSPLEDRGSDSMTIAHLVERIEVEGIQELILATNPDFEGDGTALLVSRAVENTSVRISRLARGVPTGGQLEYMNRSIISDALSGRQTYRRDD
ncbi:MAG: recombination protein RecR [Planctomycetes bacterium]|nr:recombination protein RecR [Planctomycetota bacterium]